MTGSCNGRAGQHLVERRLAVPAAPAGVDENDTYWFSGVCLLRVAVLTAVMIWRVMQSSAKLRNERLAVGAEVADRLVEPDQALLDEVVGSRRRPGSTTTPSGARTT